MSASMKKAIPCPRCGRETFYDESNPTRPFCSERCQTLDLGGWATEKYAIPGADEISPGDVNEKSNPEDAEELRPAHHRLN